MANKPKPAFYIAVFVVVAALIGVAIWRLGAGDEEKTDDMPRLTKEEMAQLQNKPTGGEAKPGDKLPGEMDDTAGITTVKEYEWVNSPTGRLPEVQGVSAYEEMEARTVKFAINVWAGWAPIVYANGGFKAGKLWKTPGGEDFKVELVLMDDPVAMRSAYAAGKVHIGWATVDMLPLLLEGMQKDSRVMPRIFQQIDWSNGGDGIVVRESIKTMADLRGKTVVLAQNSPSQFFILNALINAGVQPAEVKFKYTGDAFQAAAAYNAEPDIAGCVSWAPDIYNLEQVKGNKLIVTTATANKLIADVWYARADFAKDHGDVMEGLVRGIFDAMIELKEQPNKQKVAKWMADGYSLPESECLGMLGDAHWTNYAENRQFFLNQNNPTNFERTYNTAFFLYKKVRQVTNKVPFDKLVDATVLTKLAKDPKYAGQRDEYDVRFAPMSAGAIQAESPEILTKTVVIHFYPNSWDIYRKVTRHIDGKDVEELYDPNGQFVVEEVAKLSGQYGAARIVIEGHTDASMKGQVPPSLVKELSMHRANAVKQDLVKRFPTLQPNQFATKGVGWDRPADPTDKNNRAKNRRVEVKVYPAEALDQ